MSDQEGPDEYGLHANITNKEIAKILRSHIAIRNMVEENRKKLEEEVARLKGIKLVSSEEGSSEEDEEDKKSPHRGLEGAGGPTQ